MNGLINLGNTCYMNSIIQCISHLNIFETSNEAFIKDYQKVLHKNDIELMEEWLKLQKSLRTINSNQRINPIDFYKTFIIKLKKDGYYFVGFGKCYCTIINNKAGNAKVNQTKSFLIHLMLVQGFHQPHQSN